MQLTIAFVLLLSLWTVSVAADVTVYYDLDYINANPGAEPKPIKVSQFPWKYTYHSRDKQRVMRMFWKNKSPSVTTMNVTIATESGTYPARYSSINSGPRIGEEYYDVYFDTHLKTAKMMTLYLYSSNMLCASLLVAKGREVTTIPNEKKAQYYDISRQYGYALILDLIKQCDENAEQPQNLLLYVMIPSVIGTSAVILVIYLLWKKTYCHQSSPPAETIELNTYATTNEVVYADLGFVHADSQPPRHDEETPYVEIIGVSKRF